MRCAPGAGRKSLVLLLFLVCLLGGAAASADTILWQDSAAIGAARHELSLVLRQDGLTGRESLVLQDVAADPGIEGIREVRILIGFGAGSTTPATIRVELSSSTWKIPSGDLTVKFPDWPVRLSGRASSSARGDGVLTTLNVSRGIDALKAPVRNLDAETLALRIGMSDKSWLDIAVPALLLTRAFSLSPDELASLRAAKGL